MTEDSKNVRVIEAHAALVRHIEAESRRMRILSGVTIVVALVLGLSYAYQLLLPALGTTSVTVELTSPANMALEALLLGLTLVWLYVGVADYLFSSRLALSIKGARADEVRIGERIGE
ncbi:MAG: hypothetical protein HY296_02160 [Thaumarchaeota archaeon]|nr:hypothetical protein [Nitrososphaerota archaeon]